MKRDIFFSTGSKGFSNDSSVLSFAGQRKKKKKTLRFGAAQKNLKRNTKKSKTMKEETFYFLLRVLTVIGFGESQLLFFIAGSQTEI